MTFSSRKKPFKQKAGFCPGLKEKTAFELTELAGVCDQLVAMIIQPVTGYKRESLAQRKPFVFLSLSLFFFYSFTYLFIHIFLYRVLFYENHTRTWWKENFPGKVRHCWVAIKIFAILYMNCFFLWVYFKQRQFYSLSSVLPQTCKNY